MTSDTDELVAHLGELVKAHRSDDPDALSDLLLDTSRRERGALLFTAVMMLDSLLP